MSLSVLLGIAFSGIHMTGSPARESRSFIIAGATGYGVEESSCRASIAALLSPSVRFKESINCSVLALLLPFRTTPADGNGDPDDHPDRSQVRETEHEANKHCRSDDRACSSSHVSLRLRSIASLSSSIRISSCSI
jgi:hypothetical protein